MTEYLNLNWFFCDSCFWLGAGQKTTANCHCPQCGNEVKFVSGSVWEDNFSINMHSGTIKSEKPSLRVIELFAGIGAPRKALTNLGIPHQAIISEVDKYAIAAYNAIHGPTLNLGDIRNIESLPECDILTYGFPCQDISIAGIQKGFDEGSNTRSGLLWEVERLLLCSPKPRILLCENVEALTHTKFKKPLARWIAALARMGYTSSWELLNAKDFGIPQNRVRFFMVSCLDGRHFQFPKGKPSDIRLKDILEENVGPEYYLTPQQIANYEAHKERHDQKGHGFGFKPTGGGGKANALTAIPSQNTQNFIIGDKIMIAGNRKGKTNSMARIYHPVGISPTLMSRDYKDPAKVIIDDNLNGGV